ncbi:MAG: exostosin family protein [Sphingomonadales bacterium]|nr:exostosin family protein [Sphingomonadales bacterium]
MKTIYVVTPCFNAAETIDRTIMSVLSQAGDFRLRYHIQDGASTDETLNRIDTWKHRLRSGNFPKLCHGIHLTYASENDDGMYDALVRGFASLNPLPDDFLTWINADDILMPGAAALASALGRQFSMQQLSWFGGGVCNIRDDAVTHSIDRPIPSKAIRLGLCDGIHWDYIQQEGTFFRKWLWKKINPASSILPLKLAGDWNIWRLMAAETSFAQVSYPLGGFRVSINQLSSRHRDRYVLEINQILDKMERQAAMEEFCSKEPVVCKRIKISSGSRYCLVEETADSHAKFRYLQVFNRNAPWANRKQPPQRVLHVGKEISVMPVSCEVEAFKKIDSLVKIDKNLVAFDINWQYPAVTEKHAFSKISDYIGKSMDGVVYVAYPWATLIDKIQNKTGDANVHLDSFEQFCDLLPKDMVKITVCQHIYGKRFQHFFRQAGISHVFWSHATYDDVNQISQADSGELKPNLYYHPFPLFPVQVPKLLPEAEIEANAIDRKYLFSFVGARANKYYLTETRNWILDLLSDDQRGIVRGRDHWHYQRVVYDGQVNETAKTVEHADLINESATEEFLKILKQSTFSLCPSGSGPNSIRLWESIGTGAIPVILSDTWAPPGNPRLWEMAVIFCKEDPDEIKRLPDRLARIAADPQQLALMRHALRQIWLVYGPEAFVSDIHEFMLSCSGEPQGQNVPMEKIEALETKKPDWNVIDSLRLSRDWQSLLRQCSSTLLLYPNATLERIDNDSQFGQDLAKACKEQPKGSDLSQHFESILKLTRRKTKATSFAQQKVSCNSAPKICLFGKHANRTPLSYEPIRQLIGQRLDFVESPAQADVIVSGFSIDFRDNIEALSPALVSPRKAKLAIVSEEPLWDITWSGPFVGKDNQIAAKDVNVPYTFYSHETSKIFEFEKIPYFLLTDNAYPVRYASLISRFERMEPKDMLALWERATISAAFFLEKRNDKKYSVSFPERDVAGLSAYRTEVAESINMPGLLLAGKGWSTQARRQDLPDWHLDKLARIDKRTKVLSCFENIHQNLYITEKIFDAFAVGAIPVYYAGTKHRVFEFVPAESMLNCYDLSPQQASCKIRNFVPDFAFAEAWLDTASKLSILFGDIQAIQAERSRIADAAVQAILELA